MDVKGILEKIGADARAAAAQTLADARERADEIARLSHEKLDAQRADMEKRVVSDAAEAAGRMERMKDLEDKKETLAAKRQVMDEAFREALDILCALPAGEARAFFMGEMLSAARGGESLSVGRVNPDWFDDSFLAEANAALAARGDKPLVLSADAADGRGFRLIRGGASMDCTFAALIADQRLALEGEVAAALFD